MTCTSCRFYRPDDRPDADQGRCVKNEPVCVAIPNRNGMGTFTYWPCVKADDFCGKYERAAPTRTGPVVVDLAEEKH